MNINNKEGDMNDFGAANAPQTTNQDVQQQVNIVNVDLTRNLSFNSIEPQEQYFEVVERKQPTFGDEADFKKLLSQVMRKSQRMFEPPPPPKNTVIPSTHLKKRISTKKQQQAERQRAQEQKRTKIFKIIDPHVKNYKVLNTPNSSDTEVAKMRADFKQKSFKFLLYGIEQLKLLKQEQLSEEQKKVAALNFKGPYSLAKTLVTQIDIEFMKQINMENRQVASKKYKSFLRNFTSNIAEQSNLDLRRKILTKTLTAKNLANMPEDEFYPAHIRERLAEKKNILLSEAAAQEKPVAAREDEIEYQHEEYQPQVVQKKQEVKKPKYRFLEQSNILYIRDLLKQEQILKMRKLFDQDLRKDIEERLTNSINKVFDLAPL